MKKNDDGGLQIKFSSGDKSVEMSVTKGEADNIKDSLLTQDLIKFPFIFRTSQEILAILRTDERIDGKPTRSLTLMSMIVGGVIIPYQLGDSTVDEGRAFEAALK